MSYFATRIIAWQKMYGRQNLPWQNTIDPYAIWVSEIMLQQTQVTSVISYYNKFIQRFPNISSLANASQDEVLQYWSGLGYYSRARNLHQAAISILNDHKGQFPNKFEIIKTLPGIGRSTAAAIASFAFNQVQPILDGNVKRVLTRHFLIEGWPSSPKIETELWSLAETLLPLMDIVAYTQGLMDLGATLCTRSKPNCHSCPLHQTCKALQQQCVHRLPTPKLRKVLPEKYTTMLILIHGDMVMLEKRPSSGIWGGLWSLPETVNNQDIENEVLHKFDVIAKTHIVLPNLIHTFTHFKLHIQPQILVVIKTQYNFQQPTKIWISLKEAINAAIPTPVRKILLSLQNQNINLI